MSAVQDCSQNMRCNGRHLSQEHLIEILNCVVRFHG